MKILIFFAFLSILLLMISVFIMAFKKEILNYLDKK